MATETSSSATEMINETEEVTTSEATSDAERKKRSVIWGYFVVRKEDKSKAVCMTCNEVVSRGGTNPKHFNTSNLRKHLQSHEKEYKEFCEKDAAKNEEGKLKKANFKQLTLQSIAEKRKPYPSDHPRVKLLTYRIAEMISIDLQPFSVVEDTGFIRLVAELDSRFVLPSRRYLSEVVVPEIHAKAKFKVTELLQSTKYISMTTDIWTSTNCHHSFLSLTAHFVVPKTMEKKDVMLSAWQFDESHTGANISAAVLSHIQEWDIEEKIVCILRDNASNMVSGLNIANITSLPCFAHTLQLIIKDGVLLQQSVVQLLSCARSLVGHYHRSNVAFNTFRQIQAQLNLPQHVLIQDIATRWNSSYYMLERLVEQKKAITASNTECQPPTELRAQQWILAEKVVNLLKVFEEATREISGDYSSASIVIPIINSLKRTISQEEDDHGIMGMKRGMLRSITDRYGDIEQQPLCVLATVLDPRFKLKVFSSATYSANARMLLIQECELWLSNFSCGGSEPQPKRAKTGTQPTDKQSSSTLWSLFDEMLADSEDCSEGEGQSRNTAEIMVDMYLKEPILARSERIHPLTYWLGKKTLWPCLVDLACKYLSIPPSSVPSERLFSSAADIVSQERNRILPDKAEMLLFLKKNLPVVGF